MPRSISAGMRSLDGWLQKVKQISKDMLWAMRVAHELLLGLGVPLHRKEVLLGLGQLAAGGAGFLQPILDATSKIEQACARCADDSVVTFSCSFTA